MCEIKRPKNAKKQNDPVKRSKKLSNKVVNLGVERENKNYWENFGIWAWNERKHDQSSQIQLFGCWEK